VVVPHSSWGKMGVLGGLGIMELVPIYSHIEVVRPRWCEEGAHSLRVEKMRAVRSGLQRQCEHSYRWWRRYGVRASGAEWRRGWERFLWILQFRVECEMGINFQFHYWKCTKMNNSIPCCSQTRRLVESDSIQLNSWFQTYP
jgi:hypothetical protein